MIETKKLIDFHLDCKQEFYMLQNHFNLLFYGYGYKEKLLKKLFPHAISVNCYKRSVNEILEEIQIQIKNNNKSTNFYQFNENGTEKIYQKKKYKEIKEKYEKYFHKLDEILISKKCFLDIILINFDRRISIFKDLKNIKIIATIENINFELSSDDLNDYNFIFRDLTTFEPYEEELDDIILKSHNKVDLVVKVLLSVSKKVKITFKHLLTEFKDQKIVGNKELVNKVGKKILEKNFSNILVLFVEFFDHNILKKITEQSIEILLKEKEISEILENWDDFIN